METLTYMETIINKIVFLFGKRDTTRNRLFFKLHKNTVFLDFFNKKKPLSEIPEYIKFEYVKYIGRRIKKGGLAPDLLSYSVQQLIPLGLFEYGLDKVIGPLTPSPYKGVSPPRTIWDFDILNAINPLALKSNIMGIIKNASKYMFEPITNVNKYAKFYRDNARTVFVDYMNRKAPLSEVSECIRIDYIKYLGKKVKSVNIRQDQLSYIIEQFIPLGVLAGGMDAKLMPDKNFPFGDTPQKNIGPRGVQFGPPRVGGAPPFKNPNPNTPFKGGPSVWAAKTPNGKTPGRPHNSAPAVASASRPFTKGKGRTPHGPQQFVPHTQGGPQQFGQKTPFQGRGPNIPQFSEPTWLPTKKLPMCRNGAGCTNQNCKFLHPGQ